MAATIGVPESFLVRKAAGQSVRKVGVCSCFRPLCCGSVGEYISSASLKTYKIARKDFFFLNKKKNVCLCVLEYRPCSGEQTVPGSGALFSAE